METYFYPDELEGGRNLILNTNINAMNTSAMSAYNMDPPGIFGTKLLYTDNSFPGINFARFINNNNNPLQTFVYFDLWSMSSEYRAKNILPGREYTFSFYIKTSFNVNNAKSRANGVDGYTPATINFPSNQWYKVVFPLKINTILEFQRMTIGIIIDFSEPLPTGNEIIIGEFKMEEGNTPSPWTYNPSDIDLSFPEKIKKFELGTYSGFSVVPYSKMLKKDGSLRKLEDKKENFIVSNLKLEDMVNKLATNFAKDKNSNNYKLLNLAYLQLKKLEQDLNKQLDWMDINKAKGYALDLIGKRVDIFRGLMDDDKYRVRIKSKISENLSDGTVNTVIQALALALNINVNKVHIRPLFPEGKPATIIIENIPASSLNRAGVTQEELVDITQRIIATGVRVESINLEGTFRFSPIRNQVVVNAATGLSDVAMTTGGKLGAILSVN